MYDTVFKYLNDLIDTVNNFTIVDEDDTTYYVVVNESKGNSLNKTLVEKGFALVWNISSDYNHWSEVEFEAKTD